MARLFLGTTCLALALALAGCGQAAQTGAHVSARPAVTATPSTYPTSVSSSMSIPDLRVVQATGAPVPGTAPTWSHARLPAGFGMVFDSADLHVAASDGGTAYACASPAGASAVQVIVTHDRGATWTRVTDVPSSQPQGCQSITVDALNPHIVACCGFGQQAISVDGGAAWRLSSAQAPIASQLATRGVRTYAILAMQNASGSSISVGFSDDQLRTWHALDANLPSTNPRALWINPGDGLLLVETWPDGGAVQMWSTGDEGMHWSELPLPLRGIEEFAVQQPAAGQPWRVCASFYGGDTSNTSDSVLACTSDLGRTWTQEPAIFPPSASASASASTMPPLEMVGLPADGSLLVVRGTDLYRLPTGATRWQAVGSLPPAGASLAYAPMTAGGVLWAFPAESDGASGAGPGDAVYSAAYPQ
jgi:hypothetical protein